MISSLLMAFFLTLGDISWSTDTHDFFEVKSGVEVFHTFEFINETADTVFIENIRTSCGCTIADWGREGVAPSGLGKVEVSFYSTKKGAFYKPINVFLSHAKKTYRLSIQGRVE